MIDLVGGDKRGLGIRLFISSFTNKLSIRLKGLNRSEHDGCIDGCCRGDVMYRGGWYVINQMASITDACQRSAIAIHGAEMNLELLIWIVVGDAPEEVHPPRITADYSLSPREFRFGTAVATIAIQRTRQHCLTSCVHRNLYSLKHDVSKI